MSFGQRMNMCNITFIVSSFGIFRILNVFKQLEKMCIGEMTVLENGFCVNNRYSGLECFRIIFRKPVFADEIINLYKTGDNRIFAMPAQGDKCILWELVLC